MNQKNDQRKRTEPRLKRVSLRLEMAQLERSWAIVSAHRDGGSVRNIASSVGLGPTRVHPRLSDQSGLQFMHQSHAQLRRNCTQQKKRRAPQPRAVWTARSR